MTKTVKKKKNEVSENIAKSKEKKEDDKKEKQKDEEKENKEKIDEIEESKDSELSKEEQTKIDDATADNKRLLDNLKEALGDKVDDVVISSKLVEAPVCFSTKDGMSLEME